MLLVVNDQVVLSHLGVRVDDIRTKCLEFQSIEISHVPREANQVAHTLTRAVVNSRECVWLDNIMSSVIVADCSPN